MKVHIVIRFTNHEADVEFNRITAVTDIAADDYHRDNIEVYIITICSQCVTPHVTGHMFYQFSSQYLSDVCVVINTPISINFR